jgi:bloom syndrome protein
VELNVRVTPTKTISRADFPSTYVSSPTPAGHSRKIQRFTYGAGNSRTDVSRFNEDDDDYFEPIREGSSRVAQKKKELGPPITVDEQLDQLTKEQRDFVEIFVEQAKQVCKQIQLDRGLRSRPFSDTVLRQISIQLPRNEKELLRIPDVNSEMVGLYGRKLLRLVKRLLGAFGSEIMGGKSHHSIDKETMDEGNSRHVSVRKNNEVPEDPNHRLVEIVDLITSSEASGDEDDIKDVEREKSESDYGSLGSFTDDEGEITQTSRFFSNGDDEYTDKRVEEYNRQASQLGQVRPTSESLVMGSYPPARGGSTKRGSSKRGGGKPEWGASRGGTRRKNSSGVSKRRSGSGNFSRAAKRSEGGNRRGGGGGATSRSGIMMMPT